MMDLFVKWKNHLSTYSLCKFTFSWISLLQTPDPVHFSRGYREQLCGKLLSPPFLPFFLPPLPSSFSPSFTYPLKKYLLRTYCVSDILYTFDISSYQIEIQNFLPTTWRIHSLFRRFSKRRGGNLCMGWKEHTETVRWGRPSAFQSVERVAEAESLFYEMWVEMQGLKVWEELGWSAGARGGHSLVTRDTDTSEKNGGLKGAVEEKQE